jgi:transcriptional regulator with XRE-family HTH domain
MAYQRKIAPSRSYSRYSREAVAVLGQLIRIHRIERKLSVKALAERVGVSRDLMQRIEHGDTRCGIGVVFEAATIVGLRLFDEDQNQMTLRREEQASKLTLLPKAVRVTNPVVKDDF